jgi:NAD+ kinase
MSASETDASAAAHEKRIRHQLTILAPTDAVPVAASPTDSESALTFDAMSRASSFDDVDTPLRRLSLASSANGSGYAVEDDIRAIGDQMKRLLAFCDMQAQSPLRMQAKIQELQEQLQLAITEKNYWMKRCQEELARDRPSTEVAKKAKDMRTVKCHPRRRTNSELRFIADTIGSRGEGIYQDTDAASSSSSSDSENGSGSEVVGLGRSSFRLLQCSDEQCEVFTPMNRSIRTQHRARNNVQCLWDEPPKTVLIIKKPNEDNVTKTLLRMAQWLLHEKQLTVYLEPAVHKELQVPHTKTWASDAEWDECQHSMDFVISLGGDGTVLWVSSMFKQSVPPVLAFAMGSLGFLTPFDVENGEEHITSVLKGGFYMSLRSRLVGTIIRRDEKRETLPPVHALNEIVIDRGPSAALVELDCYCDGLQITKIAADGIIIATPTGSTAYSLSAGGSMTHPSVPSMLFTPICPHTLSFRPLLFHDSATLKIVFPMTSRASSAYVSFDGKNRVQLERGDSIIVRVSSFPVPAVCRVNENQDWFESMISNLNWNQRRAQKPWEQPTDL